MREEGQPVIEQRAEAPPGSVPKNRQTWIMLGVAVVIVLAVVFSGSGEHRDKTATLPAPTVHAPDRAEIERYAQALRNEEQRLRQAQAEASRSREVFQQQVGTAGMQGATPRQGAVAAKGQGVDSRAVGAFPVPGKRAVEKGREERG